MSEAVPLLDESCRRFLEAYFDRDYYLSAYPDVAAAGLDPLLHYHVAGWREGRNPSHVFDTRYYLRRYEDIAAAGIDPLLHYAMSGRAEGRVGTRPLDAWRRRLDDAPMESSGPGGEDGTALREGWMEEAELRRLLLDRMGHSTLVVSVSHDDYADNVGGVQNLVSDEQKAAAALGWHYLHVAPLRHRPDLAPDMPAHAFGVSLRLDAGRVGLTDMETLVSTLADLRGHLPRVEVVIHHMMSHAPELLLRLIRAAEIERPLVWAHDFFTLCPSYALLRNDVVFCGGPPLDSPACTICSHGERRRSHLARMQAFFEATRPILLAPSRSALEQWKAVSSHPVSGCVALPLGRIFAARSTHRRSAATPQSPLRIAHIGSRAFHKGWPVFDELANALRHDRRYRFYQLGRSDGSVLPGHIRHVAVTVTGDAREAMIEAVARHAIDVVISWSFWPETYCFAAYEAIAGGAFVITSTTTGNVPAMLADGAPGQGLVVESRAALFDLFKGEDLVRRLAGSSRDRAALLLGSGTIGWLDDALERPEAGPGEDRVHV